MTRHEPREPAVGLTWTDEKNKVWTIEAVLGQYARVTAKLSGRRVVRVETLENLREELNG